MLLKSVSKIRAVGLLSGGLDSTLAIQLMLDQGIEVTALNFTSPFCLCNSGGRCYAVESAHNFEIPIEIVDKGADYLNVIRHPKYGYGSGMNPCIDCRIYMLRKAKIIARRLGAKFIFTGEVLNERPMSQHLGALKIIEKETGLKNKIVRPLSAKLLPQTEAEKKGWIDRTALMNIQGRSRKPQIELAADNKLDYPCPSGGCLLTYKEYAQKVKDLLKYKKNISLNDILLLRVGRHFRIGTNKIIVGKNKEENEKLQQLKNRYDYKFTVFGYGSPLTLLQGKKKSDAIKIASSLTASYSDATDKNIEVHYGRDTFDNSIFVKSYSKDEILKLRV